MVSHYIDWYEANLRSLSGHILPENLTFVNGDNTILIVDNFKLPSNFLQYSTNLMIIFPIGDRIFHSKPDRFYVNPGLCLSNGEQPEHIFERDSFNDLRKKGWARFSFHLRSWKPSRDVFLGDTIYNLLQTIYTGLSEL